MLARLHVQGVYELARACLAAVALCAECRRAPAPAARLAPTTPGCRADRLGGARAGRLAGWLLQAAPWRLRCLPVSADISTSFQRPSVSTGAL